MNTHLLLSMAIAVAASSAAFAETSNRSDRPSVIIIFPDQLRWSSLGCYGDPVVQSPNIDGLATDGVRFTHAFTSFPVCSPARSSLLSGRYARSTGVLSNQDAEATPDRYTNRATTIAEVFAAAGYDTALIGKWHLGPNPQLLVFKESLRPRMRHRYYRQTFYRNEREVYIHDGYGPFHETDAAVEYIRGRGDRPFFLFLSYGPPHMPVDELPEKYRTLYDPARVPLRDNVWQDGKLAYDEHWFKIYMWDFQYYDHVRTFSRRLPEGMDLRDLTALYYGQITAVDDCVGRVLEAIDQAGLREDTIVLLASDHGDQLGSHQAFNKGRHYDESIRVPMIVRWAGRLKPGVADAQVMSLVDVMPTLLEMCGLKVPASVQGTSLAAVLDGSRETAGENAAFFESGNLDGVRTRRYVYAAIRGRNNELREVLHDVDADPFEMTNLAGDAGHTAVLEDLRARLEAWRQRCPYATAEKP